MTRRLFIGIQLSQDVNLSILNFVNTLVTQAQKRNLKLSWTPSENYHITLKFLGSVSEDLLGIIEADLSKISERFYPFTLVTTQLGAFPNAIRPKALYIGIEDLDNKLKLLANEIELQLTQRRFPPEKRDFIPHLTIARIKEEQKFQKFIAEAPSLESGSSVIKEIILYESITHPSGSIYRPLKSFKFKGGFPPG